MKSYSGVFALAGALLVFVTGRLDAQPSLMENLGRGVVAVRSTATEVVVSWRVLGTDPPDVAFNLYRSSAGADPIRLNVAPIDGATHYVDGTADLTQPNTYHVRPILFGLEQPPSAGVTVPAAAPIQAYLRVPLQVPPGGTTPAGEAFVYSPNDTSVGDLNGDGEYDLVVKWDPSNAKDNSQSGYTGPVYLDAYTQGGTRLWRIDLGPNIRAGAHYTQFVVYDLDGDGRAEVACRTADGTVDGAGNVIGDPTADWRNTAGYILSGPEFLTVFNGLDGRALANTPYIVPRGTVGDWGDTYGNRVDRFLATIAYLDGQRPSLVMARGYYTRTVLAAWNWRDNALTSVWTFDTGHTGTANPYAAWRGMAITTSASATSTATAATRSVRRVRDRRRRNGAVQHGPWARRRHPHVGHGSRSAWTRGIPAAREPIAVRPERARAAQRAHRRADLRSPGLRGHRPGLGARRRPPVPRLRDVGIGSYGRHVHRATVDTELDPRAAWRPDLAVETVDQLRRLVGRRSPARAARRHDCFQVELARRQHDRATRTAGRLVEQRHQGRSE